MSRTARSLAPLRHRDFRLLAAGQLASNVGDAFYAVALPWYVLADHGGALLLGTVLAAYGIPRTALLAVGGHASDRWRPWTVMMASDGVRVVAAAALAVAAAAGPARAVILVPIAIVLGAGEGMFLPGSFSVIPALLPDEDLQAGNALTSAGTQLATLAGPAIGGAMVALLGPSPAFGVDAATFAVSALTLAGVRSARRGSAVTGSAVTGSAVTGSAVTGSAVTGSAVTGSAVTGAAAAAATEPGSRPAAGFPVGPGPGARTVRGLLRSERVLQIGLLVTVAANLGSGGAGEVALPALAHGPLHTGAGGYGGLIAAFGGGALLGTIVAGRAGRARRPAITGSVAFLIEALFMAAVPYLGGALGAAAALVVFGAMNGFGNVVMITAWQRWAPRDLLGRLNGLMMTASYGIFPVSVLLGAAVVHDLGAAAFFPIAGATLALAILAGLTQPSWRSYGAIPDPASTAVSTAGTAGTAAPGESQPATAPAATDTLRYAS